MNTKLVSILHAAAVTAALAVVGGCTTAAEERETPPPKITIDLAAKPIRDVSASSCAPVLGYAGGGVGWGEDAKWLFETHRQEAARLFRRCGARLVRHWSANRQWQIGAGADLVRDKQTGKMKNRFPERTTDMKNAFSFYKEYGVKVMLTLENYGALTNLETGATSSDIGVVKKHICDYVQWIVDNGFKEVVAGFELGNEPYWAGSSMFDNKFSTPENFAARWCEIVPEIKRIFPECEIGMPLAEYFSADPDIAAVRARTEQAEKLEAKGYFDASCMNQWSARFIKAMAPQLHNVSHVIYHSYGADAPFSATYWGLRRYRRFTEAFPELKGKKFWITEWRDRADEEVPSHQRFRETLNKSAYMLMMAAHPDVDCMNLHEFRCLTGSMMWSNWNPMTKTGSWQVQWMNGGPDRPDFESAGESRAVVGSMGPAMQLMVESLLRYPVVMDFGSANYGAFSAGASNAVWACSDYYASVLDRRLGIRKGLAPADLPEIKGDCEYLVTRSKDKGVWAVLCVNMNPHDVAFDVDFRGWCEPGAPDIRSTFCDEAYADAHEIAGFGRLSREFAYQPFAMGVGKYRVRIPGNSVTTITIPVRPTWKGNAAAAILRAAVLLDAPFPTRPACGADQSPDDYRHFGELDRYGRLTVTEKGRKVCDAKVGKLHDAAALRTLRASDPERKLELVLETDIQDPEIFAKLKADLSRFYEVELR